MDPTENGDSQAGDGQPPPSPYIIPVHDWFETPDGYVPVYEYPGEHWESLTQFIDRHEGQVPEDVAQVLMQQSVLAVMDCLQRGIYCYDLSPAGVLVNRETLELRLMPLYLNVTNRIRDNENTVTNTENTGDESQDQQQP